MPKRVLIPTPLRQYAGKSESLQLEGKTIGELLRNLTSQYGDLKKHLFNEEGKLRSFVNVYLNDEDIRYLQKEDTPLKDGDTVSIVPSIAGGAVSSALQQAVELSNDEIKRYSRHLIMPEVGMDGQKKLKAASVLLIGAGGLGSPAAMYLAAAGIGFMGIVDFDVVDFSNLQRQILHGTNAVGQPKLASARHRILDINPNVEVMLYETRLTSENALGLFRDYDFVVDGTDNFPTRYLVNDACVLSGKPNVYASIFRFEGQASVFATKNGPCYRCLYPEPPPPGLVPSCAEGGVLGVLPGIIGTIQATETIKLILGVGEPLIGRLLLLDALQMRFRELKLRKNPECPACGTRQITTLIDYEQFCGVQQAQESSPGSEWEITPLELKQRLDRGDKLFILDVREPHEYQICRLEGSHLIPLGEIPQRVAELNSADEIIVHCKMGGRSAKAVDFLRQAGFKKLKNLKGGIDLWAQTVDPSVPRY
ncbi:MAG TPA: molybdopterin-synthase adenylyltransferase MoeB [Acidobacteriota bacterium]